MEESVNPLHSFILIAQTLQQLMLTEYGEQSTYPELLIPTADSWTTQDFPKTNSHQVLYPNKELGGVAGLYTWLQQQNYRVIFANDMAQEIHGIDAIAKSACENFYVICESKGTTHSFKTPRDYLKKTKSKGRQLTWQWCWCSLIDMAELGSTAHAFLEVLPAFLEGRVKRLLSVTKLVAFKELNTTAYCVEEIKIWEEQDLCQSNFLAEIYDLSKQQNWYRQIPPIV